MPKAGRDIKATQTDKWSQFSLKNPLTISPHFPAPPYLLHPMQKHSNPYAALCPLMHKQIQVPIMSTGHHRSLKCRCLPQI